MGFYDWLKDAGAKYGRCIDENEVGFCVFKSKDDEITVVPVPKFADPNGGLILEDGTPVSDVLKDLEELRDWQCRHVKRLGMRVRQIKGIILSPPSEHSAAEKREKIVELVDLILNESY